MDPAASELLAFRSPTPTGHPSFDRRRQILRRPGKNTTLLLQQATKLLSEGLLSIGVSQN